MPPPVLLTPMSGPRGCVADIALVARALPLFPVDRPLRLEAVAAARSAASSRIGWAAIFLKAYGIVAAEMP